MDEDAILKSQKITPLKHANESQEEKQHEDEVGPETEGGLAPRREREEEVKQENSDKIPQELVTGHVPVNFGGSLRMFEPQKGKCGVKISPGIPGGSLPQN